MKQPDLGATEGYRQKTQATHLKQLKINNDSVNKSDIIRRT